MGRKIVTGYAQMWPRAVFDMRDIEKKMIGWENLDKPGVYVLYRDDQPYYIGMTKANLFHRVWQHANQPKDKWYNFWNFFSAFVVPDVKLIPQIESILIAAMPTANGANPEIERIDMPMEVIELVHSLRKLSVKAAMGARAGTP
ncbi:MAG: hypothetical protein DMG21_08240 [Acidobacteria bacterium]|nr:MAG: hypothetical protein DMG21_08240 [Acidobacteriota bacterium]